MAAIRYTQDAPGRGGSGPLFGMGARAQKLVFGEFDFDTSYPAGGEDISEIFALFKDQAGIDRLAGIYVEQPLIGAQTGKFVKVNYTTKKILLYTNASPAVEVVAASDQSAITGLRFVAWGPRT